MFELRSTFYEKMPNLISFLRFLILKRKTKFMVCLILKYFSGISFPSLSFKLTRWVQCCGPCFSESTNNNYDNAMIIVIIISIFILQLLIIFLKKNLISLESFVFVLDSFFFKEKETWR
jgi:hypothetical protein